MDGLYHCPDGRWRITASDQKFTEPDERLAIARFRRLEAQSKGLESHVQLNLPPLDLDPLTAGAMDFVIRKELGTGKHRAPSDQSLILNIAENEPTTLLRAIPEDALWAYFRQQLIDRPKYVADRVGIEQLAYLADIPKPTPSPSLKNVGDLYFEKSKLSADWRSKCKSFWKEFSDSVEVKTLREVNQEHLLEYHDLIIDASKSPAHARQRFGAIKAIVNYPTKRGKWALDCKKVLAFCSVLVKPEQSATDPQPISKDHFQKLLAVSNNVTRAMLLLAMNCCMYMGEVVALDWEDVDLIKGTISTNRHKTGIVRIAVLWKSTIEAIKRLPRKTEAVFLTTGRKQKHNYKSSYKLFAELRRKAKITGVQSSHLRDGAYTNAIALDTCKLLAGHSTGISDHYVKRNPQMVAEACAAIEKAYFG